MKIKKDDESILAADRMEIKNDYKSILAAIIAILIVVGIVMFITPQIWFYIMLGVVTYLIWAMIAAVL